MQTLSGELLIREFTMDDEKLVKDFFDQMGGETKAVFNRGNGNRNCAMKFFDKTSENTVYFLAEQNGIMVGYLFLWDMDKSIIWLGIAVHETIKGKGLGQKLMKHAEEYAKEHGKGGILLTTHFANLRGQVLYERSGYEKLGVHGDYMEFLYIRRFDT